MVFYGNTDIGKKRSKNQDSFFTHRLGENALVCAVFDGMGGHAGGETASKIASECFLSSLTENLIPKLNENGTVEATKTQITNILSMAANSANEAVFHAAAEDETLHGMGTTLAAVLINGDYLYGINIGDSRVYKIKDCEIKQLSHDHSYVQYLVDIGEITEEEAKINANKSIITRAVGTNESIESDTYVDEISSSMILLCSDGLTNMVDNKEILDIVSCAKDTQSAVSSLIKAANDNGGNDNITVIVVSL